MRHNATFKRLYKKDFCGVFCTKKENRGEKAILRHCKPDPQNNLERPGTLIIQQNNRDMTSGRKP